MKVTIKSLRIVVVMVFVSISLTGCIDVKWVRPGTDDATSEADKDTCDRNARWAYPPVITRYMTREGYYEKGAMVCTTNTNGNQICKEQGGVYHDPEFSEQDQNESARTSQSHDCMVNLGYELIVVKNS